MADLVNSSCIQQQIVDSSDVNQLGIVYSVLFYFELYTTSQELIRTHLGSCSIYKLQLPSHRVSSSQSGKLNDRSVHLVLQVAPGRAT
jgi:hypothetical protein